MEEQHNKRNEKLHIGSLIKHELESQERTVSWFARKLCCDRSNVYKIFKRQTIDTDLLMKVSDILQFNFFEIFSNETIGMIGNKNVDTSATINK